MSDGRATFNSGSLSSDVAELKSSAAVMAVKSWPTAPMDLQRLTTAIDSVSRKYQRCFLEVERTAMSLETERGRAGCHRSVLCT